MNFPFLRVLLALLAFALPSTSWATDLYGSMNTDTYYVHTSSFTSQGLPDPIEGIRAVLPSLNWGGSHRTQIGLGTTTYSTCFGFPSWARAPHHTIIMMSSPHASGIREENYTCSNGTHLMYLYPATGSTASASWGVNQQNDTKRDIAMAVLKLTVQRLGGTATSTACVSNAGTNAQLLSARAQFCEADVENLGYSAGHWRSSVSGLYEDSGYFPSIISWSSLSLPSLTSGFGGMSGFRATQSGYKYKLSSARNDVLPHDIFLTTDYTSATTGAMLNQTGNTFTERTSMAFDTSRGTWAVAGRNAQTGALTVWSTSNFSTWQESGVFVDPCFPTTMCPVAVGGHNAAMTYDPASDQFVLIFQWIQSTNGNCGSGRSAAGCSGELMLIAAPANQFVPGNAVGPWTIPQRVTGNNGGSTAPGLMAYAPAAVYCNAVSSAPTSSTPNCEVIFPSINSSNALAISALKFRANVSGSDYPSSVQTEGSFYSLGGRTDWPASVANSGPNLGADILAAVKGTDGYLYINSKTLVSGSWSGWGGIATTTGSPLVLTNEDEESYHILYPVD